MIIQKKFLSIKDIADAMGTTSSVVCNWRRRDEAIFPAPEEETAAGPIWKSEDIVEYINKKCDKIYRAVTAYNMKIRKVAVLGRARTGKSYLISRFVDDRAGYVSLFCAPGADKTKCIVRTMVSRMVTDCTFRFYSNFKSNVDASCSAEQRELGTKLDARVRDLAANSFMQGQDDVMRKVEELLKEIHGYESKYKCQTPSENRIETFQKPGFRCRKIMEEAGIDTIEFIDTPGVSGSVEASMVGKSDMYIFVLRSDGSEDAFTLQRLIPVVKHDIASADVAFIYSVRGVYPNKEKFVTKGMERAKQGMADFEYIFEPLRKNIISTDIALADPVKHCIAYPDMDDEEMTDHEIFFMDEIAPKMVRAFTRNSICAIRERLKEAMSAGRDAENFLLKILREIPVHRLGRFQCNMPPTPYREETFAAEHHDRVKSNDDYRICNDLLYAYNNESMLLYEYFSSFMPSQYEEDWKREIIRCTYLLLTDSARTDRGLGIGTHQWEEYPARTMLVEESILARRVISSIRNLSEWYKAEGYIKALQSGGIKSYSWNYVYCESDDLKAEQGEKKLDIISRMLTDVTVYSRYEMVLVRYIGGLRKQAELEILSLTSMSNDQQMEILAELPFAKE